MASAAHLFRSALTVLSPKLNANVVYAIKKKRLMNWKHPTEFSEMLVQLRIEDYNHNPLVKQCADKLAVRQYVSDHGFGSILNPLLGVYDQPEEIIWDDLPDRFALKLNSGCGCNLICKDKRQLDQGQAIQVMKKWMKKKPWLGYAELQYKGVPAKIIAERFLEGKNGVFPEDYKIYCFHGKPQAILYLQERNTEQMCAGFFDTYWEYLGSPGKKYLPIAQEHMPPAPESLSMMLRAAEALSAPFPFVRIDFYDLDGAVVFGEMTFSPAGGFDVSEISVHGRSMAELLADPKAASQQEHN